jgi:hypothetical protein
MSRKRPKTPLAGCRLCHRPNGLDREGAYIMLSVIGELRVGTSPRPVIATRLIVPDEPLRAARWRGELR